MKLLVIILTWALLAACGGGSSEPSSNNNPNPPSTPMPPTPAPTPTPPSPSPPVDSDNDGEPDISDAFPNDPNETKDTNGDGVGNNAEFTSEYYEVVYGAFDSLLTNDNAPADAFVFVPGVLKVFDRNNDGFQDVLYTNSHFRSGHTGFEPSFDIINYFENDGLGRFINRTVEVFGTHTFGNAVRKISFADINKDGKLDIAFASNREDGRTASAQSSNITAANSIFISNENNGYDHFSVGQAAWSHHVELIDIDADGVIEMIDGNYTHGTRIYDINADGTWLETTSEFIGINAFDANDTAIGDFNGDGCLDTFATRQYPEQQDKSYFTGDCASSFTLLKHVEFGDKSFFSPGISWSGEETMFKVAEIGEALFAGLTNFWSISGDLNNDGLLDVIYTTDTFKITDEERANNLIIEGGEIVTHLSLLRNTSNGLEKTPALPNHLPLGSGIFLAELVDLDGDGYVDLIVDDHATWMNQYTMNDYIHFNNTDGTFATNTRTIATGLFVERYPNVVPLDYNNDGITDLIIRSNACNECMVLLKGLKSLEK